MPDQLFEDAPEPDEEDRDVFYDASDAEEASAEPASLGSSADVLVEALFEAGPEAAEHLLKAAQELLLAAKAVVDAGERVIDQHRAGTDAEDEPDQPRVRRIDLA